MPSDLRSSGRIIAAVAFTIVVGVIVWAVRNQQSATPTPSPLPTGGATSPGTTPPPSAPAPGTPGKSSGNLLAGSGVGTWTRADPRTGVIESRLDYTKLTPLPAGRYEIEQPGAWLFSSGVARAHVSAPKATVVWPTREEPPEAGDLLGGVLVRVFDASTPEGQTPPLDAALYTLAIDSIHFEGAMSQLESTDPLTVKGPGVNVEGTGLTLRFSPATKKLQYARTTGKSASIDPEALSKGIERARGNSPTAAKPETKPEQTAKAKDPLDPCELALSGTLRIAQGSRTIEAESLSILAMLQGGRLPDGAFAPFEPTKPDGKQASATNPNKPAGNPQSTPQKPIEIAWKGPLEFRNLAEAPKSLGKDLLRAKFTAAQGASVKINDAGIGANVEASTVEYGATTRTLALVGPNVKLRARDPNTSDDAENFTVDASRIDIDFTSGVGSMPGAGKFANSKADAPTAVSWSGRADFILDTTDGPAGSGGVFLPTRVTLTDAVVAKTAEGEASADLIYTTFRRIPPASPGAKPTAIPGEIVLTDSASAVTQDGVVRADRLTLAFADKPDAKGRAVPRAASGRGRAVAEQTNKNGVERIEADAIDATLALDPKSGKAVVTTLSAETAVIYTGRDGVKATSDRLDAEVQTEQVTLVGTPAVVGRYEGQTARSQRLAGQRIKLDGKAKTVTVPGPGEGTYDDPSERMVISWQREMTYDDTKGEAVLTGNVNAKAARADTDRYNTEGDRATVKLGPIVNTVVDGKTTSRRDLESVTIERTPSDASQPVKPIKVTARHFVAGQPLESVNALVAKLEGMVHLEGPSVSVLPAKHAMSVPGPGTILIEDRRSLAEAKPASEPSQPAAPGPIGSGGTSVIEWSGRLDTIENTSTLKLEGGVRIRHRPLGAAQAIIMEAAALALDLEWPDAASTDQSAQEPRLKRVLADGGVSVIHDRLRFTGDAMSYDAGSSEVIILGNPQRPVVINDAQTGATSTAQAVALDPQKGTWRMTQAGTITVPR